MKNTVSKFKFDIVVKKENNRDNEIIIKSNFCPMCLSTKDLILFIGCLKKINSMYIAEAIKRFDNGKIKNKKK